LGTISARRQKISLGGLTGTRQSAAKMPGRDCVRFPDFLRARRGDNV
jgi:hypothetical protein